MRVLSVVDGVGWGGTKEQTYLIARELSKRGLEVHMAMAFQYEEMKRKLKDYPIRLHYFEKHHRLYRFDPLNYYRLYNIIKENKYHIVIANSPRALDFVRVVYLFLKEKPKLIAYKRTGKGSGFLSKRLKYSIADRIVVVDKNTYERLREEGFYPERLVYIPSGLDLERFKPMGEKIGLKKKEELGIPKETRVFINVANWIPHHKGQPLLIEAFRELNCKDCILLLVGIGTAEGAKEYAKKHGLEGSLLGLGFREDLPELLSMSDFFVFASYFEGIAGAVLQAMACEKLVISTLAGGIKDYLVDGVNGFGVEVGSLEGLIKAMRKALELPREEIERLGKKARATALNYSIERTVEGYIKLFEELYGDIPVSAEQGT
ncbi:MAG: glycosyltransferase [Acidobacteria bacterium]|jgi:glycosyltransferase involved in cell wall biosynthesis|nr:MAG: glycosyltransferase [Acidobacteriota bacterium]